MLGMTDTGFKSGLEPIFFCNIRIFLWLNFQSMDFFCGILTVLNDFDLLSDNFFPPGLQFASVFFLCESFFGCK